MVKQRALTEHLPGQTDLLKQPYNVDVVPGQENQSRREMSAASLYLDLHGRELPNPTPMAPPIGYQKPISIADQMRQMIKMASYEAAMAGAETEQEANDFDVDEDMDPHSPWENDFEPDPELEAMIALQSRPPAQPAPAVPNPANGSPDPAPDTGAGTSQKPAASHAAQRT